MIGSDKELLMAASAFEVDNSFNLHKADDNYSDVIAYTQIAGTSLFPNAVDVSYKDGGGTIYAANSTGIAQGVTTGGSGDYRATTISTHNFNSNIYDHRSSFFKSDGTRFFYAKVNSISQADLSTAYNITPSSIGTFTNVSLSSYGATANRGIFFKPDGTRLYVVVTDASTSKVEEIVLSSAWDMTGTLTDGHSFDLTSQIAVNKAYGIWFKPDGLEMYCVEDATSAGVSTVFKYTLSTAWDLSTASYANTSFATTPAYKNGAFISFKSDGTKMFLGQYNGNKTFTYSLSTAWDITTAGSPVENGLSLTTTTQVDWSMDPSSTYITVGPDSFYDDYHVFTMSTAADVGTAFDFDGVAHGISGLSLGHFQFKPDGTKVYLLMLGSLDDEVYQFDLSTAWDLTTATNTNKKFSLGVMHSSITPKSHIAFSSDGTKVFNFSIDSGSLQFQTRTMSTAWDISTCGSATNTSISEFTNTIGGITFSFNGTGTKLYIAQGNQNSLSNTGALGSYEYTLTTAYDVTTRGSATVFNSPVTRYHAPIRFFESGSKMSMASDWETVVFDIATANDASSAVASSNIIGRPVPIDSTIAQNGFGSSGISFNNNGTTLYGAYNGRVYKFTLSTAYDISTASLSAVSGSGAVNTNPYFTVLNDEHILVGTGFSNTIIYYKMTTVGDVSTITSQATYTGWTGCRGAAFSMDGAYLYAVYNNFNVYEYALSTAFDISTVSNPASDGTLMGSTTSLANGVNLSRSLTSTNDEYLYIYGYYNDASILKGSPGSSRTYRTQNFNLVQSIKSTYNSGTLNPSGAIGGFAMGTPHKGYSVMGQTNSTFGVGNVLVYDIPEG